MRTARPRAVCAAAAIVGFVLATTAGTARSETMTVELSNGDVITGEVVERTDERIVLEHPVLGRLEIPVEEVTARSLHVGLLGTDFLAGWDKELSVGLSGSEGDTDEMDLLVGADFDYADDRRRWLLAARYELSYSDNEKDDHNAQANVLRDWLFGESRWFAFSYTTYDYDEFEAWEHRLTTGAGPGYRIIPEGKLQLDLRTGPFITYEFGDEDDARPEYALGFFGRWDPSAGHSVRLRNVYYQTLDHLEYRNVSALEWKLRIAFTQGWSFKLGVNNEYDSASKDSKNDFKYYSALAFDL
jgi:putative salt-induced outer membrane protein YdiY